MCVEQPLSLAVIGEKEQSNGTVNVRTRDCVVHGEKTRPVLLARLAELTRTRASDDSAPF